MSPSPHDRRRALGVAACAALLTASAGALADPPRPGDAPHEHPPTGAEAAQPAGVAPQPDVVPPSDPVVVPSPELTTTTDPVPLVAEEPGSRHTNIPPDDWRQHARAVEPRPTDWFFPAHFALEMRFGPYFPQVDDEFEGSGTTPYADYFGTAGLFYFGLELDWLPVRVPYVGVIGAAFGWGHTSASGNARVTSTGANAESETSLTIFPMHVSGVLRVDGPLRQFSVPVVPYLKLGLGMGVWDASGPGDSGGDGVSLGMHMGLGAALALNGFDPAGAVSLREDAGIDYAYLFGEWMLDDLGGADGMRVGTSTGVVGIAIDW